MPRRVSVPRADDLFRPTAVPDPPDASPEAEAAPPGTRTRKATVRVVEQRVDPEEGAQVPAAGEGKPQQQVRSHSGRVKHDEKMTVYVTSDELLDLEHARLVLRRTLGSAVDRGRIVRAAVALALADLDEHGEDSALVQRLRQP